MNEISRDRITRIKEGSVHYNLKKTMTRNKLTNKKNLKADLNKAEDED